MVDNVTDFMFMKADDGLLKVLWHIGSQQAGHSMTMDWVEDIYDGLLTVVSQ